MERPRVRQFIKGVLGRDNRVVSRREFGRGAVETTIGVALAAGVASTFMYIALEKENSPKKLDGQLIPGTEGEYDTQNLTGGPFPVYKERDETKQLGFSFPDQRVSAQAHLGPTYASNSIYSSHEENDGQEYGWWYKIKRLTVF